ncbi:helicase HerA-like domain-containing protein [Hyphomicrobium sp.]|uniref:helicase HerA-like domain-containing protein n=1 Tax=Hyphomicrobium sp. TaxID=82 RepID=UPI002D7A2669|nr:helicase HerA-like domain-containing protein [Hyphomicrobium sp.]HET6388318.1 helicase HerA-like domain-containing protein [Hyphomicrobium sp.]
MGVEGASLKPTFAPSLATDKLSEAFEHSITWEDDLWRADPVDVPEIHAKARRKFNDLLTNVTSGRGYHMPDRILLFHGQSGAGKTHLLRALRTESHRSGQSYFGYAQMTPDVQNYAEFYLRRLVHSLEKPYDPDRFGESALSRLTNRMVLDSEVISEADLEKLRDATLDDRQLAEFILRLADQIVACDKFQTRELDINIVRALLYLQRHDPRIDQRVRQYLNGRQLTPIAHEAVSALDPNDGEDRAFEIIAALGALIWTVDRAALVFCIDQVEDLRFFDNAEDRFQRAVRDLIQIANRLTNAIVIISCLEDFYSQVRGLVAQSYIDRIEKSGPVLLRESRTPEEARLIISKRIAHQSEINGGGLSFPDASAFFGPQFFEEFGGLSTRRLLEHAQSRLREATSMDGDEHEPEPEPERPSFISTLAQALGQVVGFSTPEDDSPSTLSAVQFREMWERFANASEAEMPADDQELVDVLSAALLLARDEWARAIDVTVKRLELGDDLPAFDLTVRHRTGFASDVRVFLCNRPTQGGGLKRQLDKVLTAMQGKPCFMLRASDFPPNKKNQTAQAFRKFRDGGGRQLLVPIPEWERMMTVREFTAHNRGNAGMAQWLEGTKPLSSLISIIHLLRLDLLGRPVPRLVSKNMDVPQPTLDGFDAISPDQAHGGPDDGENGLPANDDDLPMSVILDEDGSYGASILAGGEKGNRGRPVTLNKSVLKRHAAFLGGSGSGKTTLALSLIEQLLLRGVPAVLIDRKGDLASYANPDVWRSDENESAERRAEREKLADAIDVAVYTPGRASGRPISITLLPNGINELPDHEQQLLANLSAAALGEMLHLKNSATHQKQSGVLAVALRILGSLSTNEVTLADLIHLLEDEHPELTDQTQRMDPSGKLRRDLVAQLDSLRLRNAALFEGGGESLHMDSLLGLGKYQRPNRTRLSVIYTGFLGDNENILFWVSQFLSEALRFCQRNPNDELQAVVMFDEADLYIPANAKPATAEPLQSLLKRARSAGLGMMLATQSPGDLDYKSRDQITSWFIGRVREDTALRKLKAAFQSESGLDPASALPGQTVGEFHLVQEGLVRPMKAQRSLIAAEQVPFDRIEQLAAETRGTDERQLRLFDTR